MEHGIGHRPVFHPIDQQTDLLASIHSARFVALIGRCMPDGRLRRDLLNRLPVAHRNWAD